MYDPTFSELDPSMYAGGFCRISSAKSLLSSVVTIGPAYAQMRVFFGMVCLPTLRPSPARLPRVEGEMRKLLYFNKCCQQKSPRETMHLQG